MSDLDIDIANIQSPNLNCPLNRIAISQLKEAGAIPENFKHSYSTPIDYSDTGFRQIGSYPKVFAIGHAGIPELFVGPVLIEEKIDGSQFSFMYSDVLGLVMRSKGAQVFVNERHTMFGLAIENVSKLIDKLHPGYIYRCEYLQKPKHNTLVYDRVPMLNLIGFDIEVGGKFLPRAEKEEEFRRIGLEIVPMIYEGEIIHKSQLFNLMDKVSILGGQKIEGLVVKNYAQFGADKKTQMGKYVREDFKELNSKAWKNDPDKTTIDIRQKLGLEFNTPARWEKAIQHLNEANKLENSPRDIGPLLNEIKRDISDEGKEYIKQKLYRWAIDQILRISVSGFPEWYKLKLMDNAFESKDNIGQTNESNVIEIPTHELPCQEGDFNCLEHHKKNCEDCKEPKKEMDLGFVDDMNQFGAFDVS